MSRTRVLSLLLLPVLFLLMAFRQAPLVDPDPIAVPPKTAEHQIAKVIKVSLLHRGWTVDSEKPGAIDATLHLREHVARIAISYDSANVRIKYLSSENLKYEIEHGKPLIHKNYLSWIENLVTDIRTNFVALAD
ncbi:hypothetical protein [Dokdonella soli]|uniref:DUF3016 domain-containing protein n=1 Tax=Dokdonella soli TaxID=529810 RepID=A0ABP3TMF9_9GAMM